MTIYAAQLVESPSVITEHAGHSLAIYSGVAILDYRDAQPEVKGDWTRDNLEFVVSTTLTAVWDLQKYFSAAASVWPTSFDVESKTADLRDFGWAVDGSSVQVGNGASDVSVQLAWKTGKVRILRVGYQLMLAR